jgi:hypothetical protein
MSMILAAADSVSVLAQGFGNPTPEAPPGSQGLMKLVRWLMWFVMLSGVCGIVYSGGRFAWEKWNGSSMESPKMVVGALVGGIIATSAGSIMNAVLYNS